MTSTVNVSEIPIRTRGGKNNTVSNDYTRYNANILTSSFEEIAIIAKRYGMSFNAAINMVVVDGLEARSTRGADASKSE